MSATPSFLALEGMARPSCVVPHRSLDDVVWVSVWESSSAGVRLMAYLDLIDSLFRLAGPGVGSAQSSIYTSIHLLGSSHVTDENTN